MMLLSRVEDVCIALLNAHWVSHHSSKTLKSVLESECTLRTCYALNNQSLHA